MSAFSVENPHDGKTFENYTRFEWGVEVGVVTIFMLRLFVPYEFDMIKSVLQRPLQPTISSFSHQLLHACIHTYIHTYIHKVLNAVVAELSIHKLKN